MLSWDRAGGWRDEADVRRRHRADRRDGGATEGLVECELQLFALKVATCARGRSFRFGECAAKEDDELVGDFTHRPDTSEQCARRPLGALAREGRRARGDEARDEARDGG